MKNKFFCPFPWNHLMFKSNGRVQACCETYEHQFDPGGATIAEIANHPIIKQLRLDILDPDKVPDMCWKCENREQVLGTSVRMNTALMHKHWDEESAKQATNADGSMDNFHLEHLDIRWSNLCNYKCRFCHLGSSNLWLKETQMLGQYVSDAYNPKTGIAEYDMDWEDLKTHLPYVRYVKLAGGEPAIMPGTYQLLEELIRIGNTKKAKLTLITNATTLQYGKYDLIGLMSEFDICKVQMSMEGMGIRHEWARSGKKDWDTIAENIQQLKDIRAIRVAYKSKYQGFSDNFDSYFIGVEHILYVIFDMEGKFIEHLRQNGLDTLYAKDIIETHVLETSIPPTDQIKNIINPYTLMENALEHILNGIQRVKKLKK